MPAARTWSTSPVRRSGFMAFPVGRIAGGVALAALVCHAPLQAQGRPLVATGIQNLGFGNVIPGIPVHILRTDPVGSGRYDLRGEKNSQLQIQFTLPTTMAGPAGATLPLSFGATDAGFSAAETITSQTVFDPRATYLDRLSNNGRASIFLGGTASPGSTQAAGAYAASITLTVTYTGL